MQKSPSHRPVPKSRLDLIPVTAGVRAQIIDTGAPQPIDPAPAGN